LPERIAQNYARVCRIEFFIDVEPIANGNPAEEGNKEEQYGNPKINVKDPVKWLLRIQPESSLISGHER
jgi:hypothetical protein